MLVVFCCVFIKKLYQDFKSGSTGFICKTVISWNWLPVGVVADAAIVSSYVDGYVFVVRTMYKDLCEIRKAMEMLQSVQEKIAGFVVNDVEGKNDTDHTYGKYGYDYGSRNNK